MVSDGGGWTLIVAQFDSNGVDLKTGYGYQLYRNTNAAIGGNEPETGGIYSSNDSWKNELILDRTGGAYFSWVFAPRHKNQASGALV